MGRGTLCGVACEEERCLANKALLEVSWNHGREDNLVVGLRLLLQVGGRVGGVLQVKELEELLKDPKDADADGGVAGAAAAGGL